VFVATERSKRGKKRKIMNNECALREKKSKRERKREKENYFFEA